MTKHLIIVVGALLFSAEAAANPAWSDKLTAEATQGPHVKLVYLYDSGIEDVSPRKLRSFYGTRQSPWLPGRSTSADTGSGVRPLSTLEMCDCHVPTGQVLTYELTTTYNAMFAPITTIASVTVPADPSSGPPCSAACAQADALDGGNAGEVDAAFPVGTGGSPGTGGETATGGSPGTGGEMATGGSPGTGGETATGGSLGTGDSRGTGGNRGTGGTTGGAPDSTSVPGSGGAIAGGGSNGSRTKGGGSCAFAPAAQRPVLTMLAVLGGLMMIWRRRRS